MRWIGSAWQRLLRALMLPPLLCAAATATALAAPPIGRTSAQIELGGPAMVLTPYLDTVSGELVVHLQPRDGQGAEQLVDARRGRPYEGSAQQIMARFTRLGVEPSEDVRAGTAWDQQLLQALGCAPPMTWCTSPADADVVLMIRRGPARQLTMAVVDLRALLAAMDALMGGLIDSADVAPGDAGAFEWRLIELASRSRPRRARWLDAVRSIDSIERWQRLARAAETGPGLRRWAALRGDGEAIRSSEALRDGQPGIDLAGELERLGLRLNVARLARAALADTQPAQPTQLQALADGLLLGNQVGFRGDITSALVDVLLQIDEGGRARLATPLATEAARRRSHGLWCYSQWMQSLPCATPPWERAEPPALPAAAASAAPLASPTAPAQPAAVTSPRRPAQPLAPVAVPAPASPWGEAPQEWAQIRSLPQPLQLLAYDETSRLLVPEGGSAAGLSFVARALGPVGDGRFELQVSPNAAAALRLTHGAYRVKVRLVLDYAREDRCRAALLCLFQTTDRHARTERRDVVFSLDPGNRFVDRQAADFGHLLPLAADAGTRYASTLVQARLAIENVRFDLR